MKANDPIRFRTADGQGWVNGTYLGTAEPREVDNPIVVGGRHWRDFGWVRYSDGERDDGLTAEIPRWAIKPRD